MEIKYSSAASKELKQIARANKNTALKILQAVEDYAENPISSKNIKVLKGRYSDFKRLRVGDYRVIFDEEYKIMNMYHIKHRKEAYND